MKGLVLYFLNVVLMLQFSTCSDGEKPQASPLPALQSMPPMTCPTIRTDRNYDFTGAGPGIGSTAVDFSLKTTGGQTMTLSNLLAAKPVLLIFGSFT